MDGIVYVMSSRVTVPHAVSHFDLIGLMGAYCVPTPGIAGCVGGTVRLSAECEPQPDVSLRILESHGGQSRIDEDYFIAGAPEMIAEISYESLNYDTDIKRPIYEREGVREFILWRVEDQIVDWYVLRDGTYELLVPDENGIVRSEIFPGLWMHAEAMARRDMGAVARVLQQGLASAEHAEFVRKLAVA